MLAESYCDWWSLAGVDALVGEVPAGWLDVPVANDAAAPRRSPVLAEPEVAPLPAALQRVEAPATDEPKRPVALPGEWDEFQLWLAEHPDVLGSQWDARRVLPQGTQDSALMVLAGIGWGAYTLAGRGEPDALAGTAANFCLALPLTLLVPVVSGQPLVVSGPGLGLAILSGAVTSGIGYAMWYSIVPKLSPSTSAVLMLSVPVIAVAGGVLILGEAVGLRFLVGAVLVLGGIALSLRRG